MKKHAILKKFIYGLEKGLANSLIVKGRAGYGKTSTTLQTLKDAGLERDKGYMYFSNYTTPLQFYKLLQEVNELEEPKILILDDIEETLKSKKVIGLLKGALWATDGKREVSWRSSSHKVSTDRFNFEGRIIFLLNEFDKKDTLLFAIKDRGFYYEIDLSNQELMSLMEEKALKEPYRGLPTPTRVKIVNHIKTVAKDSKELTLRLLPKAYNAYILSPQHYQHLIKEMV